MKSDRMKKWIAGAVFSLLGIVVIGFSIKLSYDVMAILFPNDPVLKFMAIALFDGGVIGWLLAYVAKAKGTPQRGVALLMTVLDFLGVAAMAIGGIYLSGQTLADIPTWVGGTVVVTTIIATVLNAGAFYYYHANDPQTREEIQAQELEDELNEEALDQAKMQVERNAQMLGAIIASRVTARMKYRMRLPMSEQEVSEWQGETIDAQAYEPASLPPPPPAVQQPTFWEYMKSFFGVKPSRPSSVTQPLKNSTVSQQELEKMATNSTAEWAWQNMKDGSRRRVWCKTCKQEGSPWYTPEPCEHILNAKAEQHVSEEELYQMLDAIWNEDKAQSQPEPIPYQKAASE